MRFIAIQTVLLGALLACAYTGVGPRLHAAVADPSPLARVLQIAGAVLLGVAGALTLAAVAALGRSFRIGPRPRPGTRMVSKGVYRHLRHPMYTSVVVVCIGLALLRPTVAVAVCVLAIIAFYLVKARHEETLLAARYPDYPEYRRRTLGVIPLPPFPGRRERAS
jgi:protein-S-isoprenylcysteine O-methyltransferase Ste14